MPFALAAFVQVIGENWFTTSSCPGGASPPANYSVLRSVGATIAMTPSNESFTFLRSEEIFGSMN